MLIILEFSGNKMPENILQTKNENPIKCIKCRKRDATSEDHMCDSCRYMVVLENIISAKNK